MGPDAGRIRIALRLQAVAQRVAYSYTCGRCGRRVAVSVCSRCPSCGRAMVVRGSDAPAMEGAVHVDP